MTQGELEKLPLGIQQVFSELEMRIMSDVVRRIKENGFVNDSAEWQISRLQQLGDSQESIMQWIQEALQVSDDQLEQIFSDQTYEEYTGYEKEYKATDTEFIPYEDNRELQQTVEASRRQTEDTFQNMARSLGFALLDPGTNKITYSPLREFYEKTLDNAIMDIQSGAFSYSDVLKRTINKMTTSGVRWIDYDSGAHNRVDVAARRAVLTGFRQVQGKINEQVADELQTDYYEVTWHGGARPEHQRWQGKVYSMRELRTVCGLGEVTGLKGANCYHDYRPFIPGVSVRTYTDDQLEQMNAVENRKKIYNGREYTTYEALQQQRKMETTMRKYRQDIKLLEEGGADEEDIVLKKAKYQGLMQTYKGFSKKMRLPEQKQRIYQDGLGKTSVKKQYTKRQAEKFGGLVENSPGVENQKRYAARREEWKKRHAGQSVDMNSKSNELTERRKARMEAWKNKQKTELQVSDFAHMDRDTLMEYANKKLLTRFGDTKGVSVNYLRDAVKTIDAFEKKMGGKTLEGLSVKFGATGNGIYAKYDDKTKTILLKKTGDIKAFEESQKKANLRYRYKWKTDKDYYATETFSGTLWHELGHAVDVDTGQELSRRLSMNSDLDAMSVRISSYAGSSQNVRVTKRSEAWAENFAAYMDGGRNKEKVPEQISDMIEDYFKSKSIAKTSNSDTIISGAVSGARNPHGVAANKHAEKYYGLVRSMKTDVTKIAETTGRSEKEIQEIKNYIFIDEHDLGTDGIKRFAPDYMMAESWRRLIAGEPEQHDLTLINHEIMEKKLIQKGYSQGEAHIMASKKYNYGKEAYEFYDKIKKYRKE